MVLVDTTVWIDFFAGKATSEASMLELLISEGEDICICGIVLTEVLQGIRDNNQYTKIKAHFDKIVFLPMTQGAFVTSAEIYRSLRKKGITIRKPLDCIIASVAIAHNVQLLHNDSDFNPIQEHCGLKVLRTIKR